MSDENKDLDFVKLAMEKGGVEEAISLADLAGIDMSDVGETRFAQLPLGQYILECVGGEKAPSFGSVNEKAAARFNYEVVEVVKLNDKSDAPDGDPSKLVGKIHQEMQFITSKDSFGYLNAYIVDTGGAKTGPYAEKFASCVGVRFKAFIFAQKDRNDKDRIYHRIKQDKIQLQVRPA